MQTCSIWCRAGQPSSSSTAAPEGSTKQFAIRQEGQFQAGTRGRGWGDEGGSQCGGPSGVGQSGLQASQQTNSALQHYSTANVIDNCVLFSSTACTAVLRLKFGQPILLVDSALARVKAKCNMYHQRRYVRSCTCSSLQPDQALCSNIHPNPYSLHSEYHHLCCCRECFDAVYGSSAGAINATYFLSGQREGVRIYYEDIANKQFVDLSRLLDRKNEQG